ncbi:unnamed protein product [Brassica rapa]|uniref:Secreted protein n=1 Tax=Brassica campestris TaxID=3711 RepID=A0A8D9GM28_BRACM|nr:unnamed protein product [Brassica rapa]
MHILNITTLCCLCVVAHETREYVLISCVYCREVWKLILLRLDPVCNLFSSWLQLLSWLRQGSAAAPKTMRTVVAQAAIFSSMASTQQTQQRSSQPRVNKGHKFV